MVVQIGKAVWLFDTNCRIYEAGRSGPVYAKHFKMYHIESETRSSWVLSRGDYKIDKKTGLLRQPSHGGFYGLSPHVYWSQEEVDDACFVQEHRYHLGRLVQDCQDPRILRKIAEILR